MTKRPQSKTNSLQGIAGAMIAQVLLQIGKAQTTATDPAIVEVFNREIDTLRERVSTLEREVATLRASQKYLARKRAELKRKERTQNAL